MPKITLEELETMPFSVIPRYDEYGTRLPGGTIPKEMLYDRVGDLIGDEVFGQLEYVDTPVEQTGRFSCISRMRTPRGRELMVLEANSGEKRLSW